ncbi:alanine--tRNA ligase [Arthrobacter sp. Hiyo4]|nr:alanine--tRNA ligase [Arthrobacter sp. Hiyo4]
MAEEAGLKVDEPEFRRLMLEQRQRAQADAKGKKGGHADLSAFQELLAQGETVFTGYTDLDGESRVRASSAADRTWGMLPPETRLNSSWRRPRSTLRRAVSRLTPASSPVTDSWSRSWTSNAPSRD